MDNIEVKLDEIEEHVLKTQADVDRLMRDFSKPDKAKDILGGMPGGGGGMFDQIIKAITGGGKGGGMMGAGVAGGMAAVGIMALVDILKDAVSNSKILTTVLGTIGQALGLLIDVILLPFLPFLITGIIWLYEGIMIFYKFWNGIWSGKTIQTIGSALSTLGTILAKGIGGLLQLGINFLGAAGSMIWNFLQWLWGIATAARGIELSLLFDIAGAIWNFLQWLWGIAMAARGIELSLLFNIAGAIWNFLQWLWNVTSGIRGAEFNLLMSIGGAAASFLQWLWNTITSGGANLLINLTSGVSNAASSALSGAGSWLSGLESGIGNLLHFDQGGVVPGSGPQLAVVHGGETVTKAGQSTGNITINANNYVGSKTELMKVVTDALRQNQYRYNV